MPKAYIKAKKAANPTRITATGPMKFVSYPKWFSMYHLMVGSGVIPGALTVSSTSPNCDTMNPYTVHDTGHI